ncbi:MAG: SPOR domain-containing protein [Proteobacteria bacterium]|nr:SPOR domain-containing protein [Pseudomonadota bacterium]
MGRISGISLAGIGLALIIAGPALADTKAGVDAWSRGDYPGAVRAWQAEADKGDADALYNLGQAYRLGKGVKQDLGKAKEMYGRAAAQGHLQAADNYGLLLFQQGEQARALPYITAAADRGEPRAQYLLGIAHFNGQLVTKDWVRAYALVSLAQQGGVAPAATALKQMDGYIPIDQRQQSVQLASELRSRADANRARQFAAADLGTARPGQATPVRSDAPTLGEANNAVAAASRVAGTDSPASAGADYARPATTGSIPQRPVASQTLPVTKPAVQPPRHPAVAAVPPAPPKASTGGRWRVQLGAFGVAANADAQWARVAGRPELAGHPRINAAAGSVIKLQAGGFSSQEAAQDACTRLKTAGLTCIAVSG